MDHARLMAELLWKSALASEDGNSPSAGASKQLSDAALQIMKSNKGMRLRPLIEAVKKEVSYLWSASKDLNKE